MATDILESAPWSMVKMVILWSNFVVRSTVHHFDLMAMVKIGVFWLNFLVKFKVDHFDHGKFGFWPWSWSKF